MTKRLVLLTAALGAALSLGAVSAATPSLAHHLKLDTCILVDGEWYCPLRQCHPPIKRTRAPVVTTDSNGNTVIVLPDDEDPEVPEGPKPPKEHDDNGHGNDEDGHDESNPGKKKN